MLLIICFSSNAFAVTLYQALNDTFKNNTQLNAERENIKASEEDINISQADYMPSLTLTGTKSFEDTNKLTNQSGGDAAISDVNPLTSSIKLEQTLLDYGRDISHEKNIVGLELAKAKLIKKEQDVIYSAIEAFTGLILAREKLEINRRNLNLLIRQVETDKVRLDRGQITITDLSQSESSLAGAEASFIAAGNELLTAKTNFERIIRTTVPDDINNQTDFFIDLPNDLKQCLRLSLENNPKLMLAKLDKKIAERDINIERSKLSPSASINYSKSKSDDFSVTVDDLEEESVKATVTWPIIKGGKNYSSLKKAKFKKNKISLILEDTVNEVKTETANAWSLYQSAESVLSSTQAQVKAAEIANEGITIEYDTGNTRTTLEVIQSRSLLLSARIANAKSERDFIVSKFELLAVLGNLSLKNIKKS